MNQPHRKIATALACATSALLGNPLNAAAQQAPAIDTWQLDSALLFYTEPGRVSAVEPVIGARRQNAAGSILSLKGVVDVLTGASGTGAVATDAPQTFTRPSGNGTYVVAPGDTPLDDTFKDTRVSISADWDAALRQNMRYGLGTNVSKEYDYQSVSVNGRLTRDFNQKNTTLSIGLAQAFDTVSPVGGVPVALSAMATGPQAGRAGSDNKSVTDVLLGVTQIIDARSLLQFNYGLTASSGYLTDPYKFVSLVDANGRPLDGAGRPNVVYESRPDSRTRHSLYARYKRLLDNGNLLDTSYRFTTDDWGVTSHTIDTRYRFDLGSHRYLQARLRLYQQSAADFYQPFLQAGAALPAQMTADYRLADMSAFTVGVEYGWGKPASPWRVALEYYQQNPKEPGNKFGELANQTLAPSVNAIMLRFNKTF